MRTYRAILAKVVLLLISVFDAQAQGVATSDRVEAKIGGVSFSLLRAFVISRKPPTKDSPEHLWVAFSHPGYEPLGTFDSPDDRGRADREKRAGVRSRGQDVIDLKLQPEQGLIRRLEKAAIEKNCAREGRFVLISAVQVSGYSCAVDNWFVSSYFPISTKSATAIFSCMLKTESREGTPQETCELIVENRKDRIGLTIMFLSMDALPKASKLIDAAENFVAEQLKRQ